MLILGIETATERVSVAIGGHEGVIGLFEITKGRRHAETLVPAIEFTCRQAGIDLGEVSVVAVDVGPGLFTGMRVGLASAKAIDQLHVEVQIADAYRSDPIKVISFLLTIPIQLSSRSSRVVINEREGVVVIGKDVEIAPVLITHRNLRIEAGGGSGFVAVSDSADVSNNAKLKSLADALNALDVPTEDLIAIIKTLKRKGDLFGEVVFQ